jgi:hypothetical protein
MRPTMATSGRADGPLFQGLRHRFQVAMMPGNHEFLRICSLHPADTLSSMRDVLRVSEPCAGGFFFR